MQKIGILFFLLFISTSAILAQCENSKLNYKQTVVTDISHEKGASIDLGENDHPFGGTFQFIISKDAKSKEIFTTEILSFIEENRLENEEKILVLSPNTKVRILSKNQISDSNFKPLTNLYSIEK